MKKSCLLGAARACVFSLTAAVTVSTVAIAEPSGTQLKADLDRVLAKSYDSSAGQDSAFNSIIINLQTQLNEAQDWEFDQLAPLIGNQVNQLSRLRFFSSTPEFTVTPQEHSFSISSSDPAFPNASYPDAVAWNFGIGAGDGEPTGDPQDESESGECSGSVRNTPRAAFDLQMGAIITEGIARVADSFCEQVVVALGGGNLSIACIITEIADVVVQGVLDANLLCDDIKDSVEVEASYKRLEHIHDDLDTVNTEVETINTAVTTVNGLIQNLDTDLSVHDTTVKTIINTHDTTMKEEVGAHDTDIKLLLADIQTKLEVLQATADTNGAVLLEVVRLLHTPSGKRTSDVPACNGADCEWNR